MAIDGQNEERKEQLKDIIRTKESLAFVGAGCSRQCGYPSWPELLRLMADEVVRLNSTRQQEVNSLMQERDKLWVAEKLRRYMGEDVFGLFIREHFQTRRDSASNNLHGDLVRMNFCHFLTTNYDDLIEQSIRFVPTRTERLCSHEEGRVQHFIRNLNQGSYQNEATRYVFYLHGRYDSPGRDIVLSERAYARRYKAGHIASRALWMVAAMRKIVFIGFGFEDLDLLNIFREVHWELGDERNPRHFAIIGLKSDELGETRQRSLLDKYGIQSVFYEIGANMGAIGDSCNRPLPSGAEDHGNLVDVISEIARTPGCSVSEHAVEDSRRRTALDESHRILEYTERHIAGRDKG